MKVNSFTQNPNHRHRVGPQMKLILHKTHPQDHIFEEIKQQIS